LSATVIALAPGSAPHSVEFSPDGAQAYIANAGGGTGTVEVIDTATDSIVGSPIVSLPSGENPWSIAFSPDGSKAYVAVRDASVLVIDVASATVLSTVALPTGAGAWSVAVSPDGATVYVTNNSNNSVSVIKDVPALASTGLNPLPLLGVAGMVILAGLAMAAIRRRPSHT
ncbi:MAG TPA: beta-propeller fold lactonase family protein, partial [Rhodoglobus sp.]|nr:beta-propeller fold lactonase family protein [Rhodoglobus sp.]